MSQPEDFNIVPEEQRPNRPRQNRTMFWVGAILLVALFAFAVGLAVATLTDRLGDGANPTLLPVGTNTAGQTETTPAPTVAVTATASSTNTPTLTPTKTPALTPTQSCPLPLASDFVGVYESQALGCPVSGTDVIWSAWETFERGAMLWRSDTDRAYAIFADGTWSPIDAKWEGQAAPGRGDPPPGLVNPERGFGFAWATDDQLFQRLGWATAPEKGYCALVQSFDHGFALASNAAESCTPDNLYNHVYDGDWQGLSFSMADPGVWRGFAGPFSVLGASPETRPQPVPTGEANLIRPVQNGVFVAAQGRPVNLDGNVDDWPGNWMPLFAVIQGADAHTGSADASGQFQLLWAPEGLYLAARVLDDVFRPGPEGSELWRGDGLEIQFDRQLAADFPITQANEDDIQLGLSYGPGPQQLRGYQWLPFALEGRFDPAGAITISPGGYSMETLLPWSLFGVQSMEIAPGAQFGFNLSVNDNDSDGPAQQTVISASPARTTHDNPVEWGTLFLQP